MGVANCWCLLVAHHTVALGIPHTVALGTKHAISVIPDRNNRRKDGTILHFTKSEHLCLDHASQAKEENVIEDYSSPKDEHSEPENGWKIQLLTKPKRF